MAKAAKDDDNGFSDDGDSLAIASSVASMDVDETNLGLDDGEVDVNLSLKEGKRVLVKRQSAKGDLLYDARILEVFRPSGEDHGEVTGVRVHYNKYSSRFDEWVSPSRLVKKGDDNYDWQQVSQPISHVDNNAFG